MMQTSTEYIEDNECFIQAIIPTLSTRKLECQFYLTLQLAKGHARAQLCSTP